MKILIWLIVTILSAILYRMGGAKGYNTKFRDLGCPLANLILLWYLGLSGAFLLKIGLFLGVFLLMFGALTTYWDSLFGYDNFWFHGFMIALACFPLYWLGVQWWIIIIRCVVLAIGMGWWSKIIGNDVMEELGRGALITLTLPILLYV